MVDELELAPGETRRNVTTRGVALNGLVGRTFWIGDVLARGSSLCEPCRHLEEVTGKGLLRALVHRGGLRADALTSRRIAVGDSVEAVEEQKGVGAVVVRGGRVLLGRRLSVHGRGTWSFPAAGPSPVKHLSPPRSASCARRRVSWRTVDASSPRRSMASLSRGSSSGRGSSCSMTRAARHGRASRTRRRRGAGATGGVCRSRCSARWRPRRGRLPPVLDGRPRRAILMGLVVRVQALRHGPSGSRARSCGWNSRGHPGRRPLTSCSPASRCNAELVVDASGPALAEGSTRGQQTPPHSAALVRRGGRERIALTRRSLAMWAAGRSVSSYLSINGARRQNGGLRATA